MSKDNYTENGKFNSKKWIADNTVPIVEAGMDKTFEGEWESNCKALHRHIGEELKTAKGADKGVLKKMLTTVATVAGYPKLMGKMFGYE